MAWAPPPARAHASRSAPGLSLFQPVALTDEALFIQNLSQSQAGLGVFP